LSSRVPESGLLETLSCQLFQKSCRQRTRHESDRPPPLGRPRPRPPTPLIELSRLTRDLDGQVLAKLYYLYSKTVLKERLAHDPDRAAAIAKEDGDCLTV
jgi:hypothetical protein